VAAENLFHLDDLIAHAIEAHDPAIVQGERVLAQRAARGIRNRFHREGARVRHSAFEGVFDFGAAHPTQTAAGPHGAQALCGRC